MPELPSERVAQAPLPGRGWASAGNALIGEAHDFQERREGQQTSWTIWCFRLERFDAAGNRLQPVPVEMRGLEFDGAIAEGDWIEIRQRWQPGDVSRPRLVHNLTTGATVSASVPISYRFAQGCGLVITILVLGGFAVFGLFLLAMLLQS